jgi:hypothetical protein
MVEARTDDRRRVRRLVAPRIEDDRRARRVAPQTRTSTMRTLLQVELDTELSNKLISNGTIQQTMNELMGTLKPEAAYFYAANGHRAMTLVVDLADESAIVTTCEPFWLSLHATVRTYPCMNAEELQGGLGRLPGAA